MERTDLFREHLQQRQRDAADALEETGFETLVISSGEAYTYFADDADAPRMSVTVMVLSCSSRGRK